MSHIPAHVAAGRRAPFPAGVFVGELTKVTDIWSDDRTAMALVLTFSNNTPFDADSPQIGARPKMQRVQIVFDNQSLVDITQFDESVPLPLQNAATLVTQLAAALGLVTANADGSVDFEMEPFIENLMAGAYCGTTVVFEVRHRAWKSKKTGNSGIDDSIVSFKSAAEQPLEPAAPEPVAPEPEAPTPEPAPAAPVSALRRARSK